MPNTLQQAFDAAVDSHFLQRVTIAISAAAQAISTEPATTTNHLNRVALMKLVAANPQTLAYPFAFLLASQGLDNTASDAAINAMVSAVWNTAAGVP